MIPRTSMSNVSAEFISLSAPAAVTVLDRFVGSLQRHEVTGHQPSGSDTHQPGIPHAKAPERLPSGSVLPPVSDSFHSIEGFWWRSQNAEESGVRLQRPLLASTLHRPELGGANPPLDGAVEELKRYRASSPMHRFLAFRCAVSSLSRSPVRRSLALVKLSSAPFPLCLAYAIPSFSRAPFPLCRACPYAVPSPSRAQFPLCLACPCVPSLRCLARSPLAVPLARSDAVRSLAPVSCPSAARCVAASLPTPCIPSLRCLARPPFARWEAVPVRCSLTPTPRSYCPTTRT